MTRPLKIHRPLIAIVAALPLFGTAAAQAQPRSGDPVPCEAFQRQPLGAWTVLRAVKIAPGGVEIELPAGRTFTQDETFEGVDVSTELDRYCGNHRP